MQSGNRSFLSRNKASVILLAILLSITTYGYAAPEIRLGTDPDSQVWFGFNATKQAMITNSNGKSWTVTGANLQSAIDDLEGTRIGNAVYNGGKIIVGGDIEISTTIIAKNNTVIDFQNYNVTFSADVDFINLTDVSNFELRNVVIQIPSAYTSTLITLYATGSQRCSYNKFEHIYTNPDLIGSAQEWNGIKLHMHDLTEAMYQNVFRDITLWTECDKGIWLKASGTGGSGYMNTFENIMIWNFKSGMIYFDVDGGVSGAFYRNSFYNVKSETDANSIDGVYNISHVGNVFIDCHVWDWHVASSPNYCWSLAGNGSEPATDTLMINCGASVDTLIDNGTNTLILSNQWGCRNLMVNNSIYMPVYGDNDNLGLHLAFSNGSGTDILDYSGYNNHGTITTGYNWTNGKYGSNTAIDLNGLDEYVDVDDADTLDFSTGAFTVMCWIQYPLNDVAANTGIVSKGLTPSAPDHSWGLATYGSNTNAIQYFDAANGGGSWNVNDLIITSISSGWHHFAITRTGTTYTLYMDGVLEDTSTHTAVDLTGTAELRIGRDEGSSYNGCVVDDVKVYTRCLDIDEIRSSWLQNQPNKFSIPTVNMSNDFSGESWFDTANNILYIYNGTAWVSTTLT